MRHFKASHPNVIGNVCIIIWPKFRPIAARDIAVSTRAVPLLPRNIALSRSINFRLRDCVGYSIFPVYRHANQFPLVRRLLSRARPSPSSPHPSAARLLLPPLPLRALYPTFPSLLPHRPHLFRRSLPLPAPSLSRAR